MKKFRLAILTQDVLDAVRKEVNLVMDSMPHLAGVRTEEGDENVFTLAVHRLKLMWQRSPLEFVLEGFESLDGINLKFTEIIMETNEFLDLGWAEIPIFMWNNQPTLVNEILECYSCDEVTSDVSGDDYLDQFSDYEVVETKLGPSDAAQIELSIMMQAANNLSFTDKPKQHPVN